MHHWSNVTIHVALVLGMSPLLRGVIVKTKARFAGRVGAPLLQPYYDLAKLFRKGSVFSGTTTWVFRLGPIACLSTSILAALLIPFGTDDTPVSFRGDLIVFAYLFGLSRFWMCSAALDTGSPFEGMGAAREATFACLAEPALFFGLLVTAWLSKSLELTQMLGASLARHWLAEDASIWGSDAAALLLVLVSWFIVLLAENCRVPFDDPNTHLELTMIHEVIVLDHGGPALGMILCGAAIKLFLYAALITRLILPFEIGPASWPTIAIDALNWVVFVVAMLAVAVAVGIVESTMARLRMTQIPKLLITACVLSALGLVLLVR